MNCLIVDDEILAQEVLTLYIGKVGFLNLKGCCNNALQAFAMLSRQQVDIMFLDIKMPEMSGIELLKSIKNPPKVIITTAFNEYALEGYELDIVDYLLKPIRFERFLKAVNKIQNMNKVSEGTSNIQEIKCQEFYVRSDRKLIKINPTEVTYIESLKNYICINIGNRKVIVHSTLSDLENELKAYSYFQRVHKSFIINTNFISELNNDTIHLKNQIELPIGGNYKDSFIEQLRILNFSK